jgi:hypothetical protein
VRVPRHVAVVAEFAERDPQPVALSDADHGVGVQADELTAAHAGAGEQFHDQPVARVLAGPGGEHELRGLGVIE